MYLARDIKYWKILAKLFKLSNFMFVTFQVKVIRDVFRTLSNVYDRAFWRK